MAPVARGGVEATDPCKVSRGRSLHRLLDALISASGQGQLPRDLVTQPVPDPVALLIQPDAPFVGNGFEHEHFKFGERRWLVLNR